ncbi:hypothetical protein WM94_22815 [Pseudomonas sp. ABFPK]|nr:hypothetical protein WM94_22815 [Pseudomonas sp. ABFPK]
MLQYAIMEYTNSIRHGQCFILIVSNKNNRYSQACMQLLDLDLHVLTQLLIQRPQGLVHQDQLWFENKCSSERHTLLLATRELRWHTIDQVAQANVF